MTVISSWLDPVKCDFDSNLEKTAIQLPLYPQPHLDWPVSSSLYSCPLKKIEKRYSFFFWIALWSADRQATWNMVLSSTTQISIKALKLDDMELTISLMFFLTWVFRMQCRAKIRKPCSIKMISGSLISKYANKLVKYLLRFSRRKGNYISYNWKRSLSSLAWLKTFVFTIPKTYHVTIVTVSHLIRK